MDKGQGRFPMLQEEGFVVMGAGLVCFPLGARQRNPGYQALVDLEPDRRPRGASTGSPPVAEHQNYTVVIAASITGLLIEEVDEPGFWEKLGGSNTADPWTEDRTSQGTSTPCESE